MGKFIILGIFTLAFVQGLPQQQRGKNGNITSQLNEDDGTHGKTNMQNVSQSKPIKFENNPISPYQIKVQNGNEDNEQTNYKNKVIQKNSSKSKHDSQNEHEEDIDEQKNQNSAYKKRNDYQNSKSHETNNEKRLLKGKKSVKNQSQKIRKGKKNLRDDYNNEEDEDDENSSENVEDPKAEPSRENNKYHSYQKYSKKGGSTRKNSDMKGDLQHGSSHKKQNLSGPNITKNGKQKHSKKGFQNLSHNKSFEENDSESNEESLRDTKTEQSLSKHGSQSAKQHSRNKNSAWRVKESDYNIEVEHPNGNSTPI